MPTRSTALTPTIAKVANLESVTLVQTEDDLPPCAIAIIDGRTILAPFARLVDDVSAELARLDKRTARTRQERDKCAAKLANASFVANAPESVVTQERERVAEFERQLAQLGEQIATARGHRARRVITRWSLPFAACRNRSSPAPRSLVAERGRRAQRDHPRQGAADPPVPRLPARARAPADRGHSRASARPRLRTRSRASLGLAYQRIQFTSDLLPADIIGVSIFEAETGQFRFHRGPVFAQLVLADEVNRATPKAQSALLEAMEEHQVTADGQTYPLNEPFFVIATQNPAYQIGTFPLPESQLDRFLMRIELGYPEPGARTPVAARPRSPRPARGAGAGDLAAATAAPAGRSAARPRLRRAARLRAGHRALHAPGRRIRSGPVAACRDRAAARRAGLGAHASASGRAARGRAGGAAGRRRASARAARHGALSRRAAQSANTCSKPFRCPKRRDAHASYRLSARASRTARTSWIRRRQGDDVDPVELRRNRIYILPTRSGIAYAAMVFAMLLGGMNYNNNLGLGLTFVLVSLGLVAMHHCHGTLSGLQGATARGRARVRRAATCITACCCRTSRAYRGPPLELAIGRNAQAASRRVEVPAAGSAPGRAARARDAPRPLALERFVVATHHPLGPVSRLGRRASRLRRDCVAASGRTRAHASAHANRHRWCAGQRARRRGLCGLAGLPAGRFDSPHRVESVCARSGTAHQAIRGHRRRSRTCSIGTACRASTRSNDSRSCAAGSSMRTAPAKPSGCACPDTSIETNVGRRASATMPECARVVRRTGTAGRMPERPGPTARAGLDPGRARRGRRAARAVHAGLGHAAAGRDRRLALGRRICRQWPLPRRGVRLGMTFIAAAGVFGTYRTLNGIEAGTAFLVLMVTAKLLETRATRDVTILAFIAWFLLYAALLRDQGLLQLPWLAGQRLSHDRRTDARARRRRRHVDAVTWQFDSGALLLQAVPLALLLFLLFPRLPGSVLGHRLRPHGAHRSRRQDDARRRLGPQRVGRRRVSCALRGRFAATGAAVLARARAARVRRSQLAPPAARRHFRAQDVSFVGKPVEYEITLEPHGRRWVLALDLPSQWPERQASQAYDFTLLAPRADQQRHGLEARVVSTARRGTRTVGVDATQGSVAAARTARNPRAVALGRALRARHRGRPARRSSATCCICFRTQPFIYTLEPPRLADNAVDEFLFSTRKGFCEHYASAFTVVMRAAGIPARVVTGYQGGEFNPYGDYLIVRQSDAHAWSEVWIEGRGWRRVDPDGRGRAGTHPGRPASVPSPRTNRFRAGCARRARSGCRSS